MPRNVGSIEISVVAETGRLKAQLVRDGKVAGKGAAKAIERELKGLQADIDLQTSETQAAARLLRKRIEAALEGIPVDVDIREAQAQIQYMEAWAEARSIALNAQINDRDIAEINAQLRSITEEHREADIQFEADLTAINTKVAAFVNERREAEIQFEADLTTINTRIAAFLHERREATIQMDVDLRTALAEAEADAIRAEIEQIEATIQVDAETRVATLAVLGFKERTEADDIAMSVELETMRAKIEADLLGVEIAANRIQMGVDIDPELTKFNAEMAAMRRRQESDAIEVPVRLSEDSGGDGGLLGGLSTRMRVISAAIVELMQPAAVAIEGLASGAVQVLSSAFSALAGTGGALIPIMAGLGASLGAVVIGSLGMGKAIKANSEAFTEMEETGAVSEATLNKIDKAMRQLTPAAAGVTREIAAMLPQFRALQSVVAANLFVGMAAEMRTLSQQVIPDIGAAMAQAAGVANRFGFELSAAFQDIDFSQTFAEISPALDSLGRAIADVVRAIQPFFEAAAPAARELGAMIERAASSLLELVDAGNRSGAITEFFNQGLDSLRVWGDLIANVGRALLTLFEAGTAGGNSLVQSLSDIIGRFNDWMNTIAGQSALEDFFTTGREVLSSMTPILTGLAEAFKNLVTPAAISNFAEMAEAIGRVLPVAAELIQVIDQLGLLTYGLSFSNIVQALDQIATAIKPILPALHEFATAFEEGISQVLRALQPLLDAFAESLGRVLEAVTPLIPIIADLAEELIKAVTPGLIDSFDALAEIIEELAPFFELLLKAALPLIQVFGQVNGALLSFGALVTSGIAKAIGFLVDGFVRLSEVAQDFLDLLGKIPFLGAFLDWLGLTTDETQATADAADNLTASAEALAPAINDAADVIADAALAAENAVTGTDRLQASYAALVPAINDAARAVEGDIEVAAKATRVTEKMRKEQDKLAVSLLKVQDALGEMQGAFGKMARNGDALQRVFDLGNAPEVAAAATRDIEESVGGLKDALKGIKVGDVLAGNFKADKFLDAIDELRPQIQSKLAESFSLDPTGTNARADALRFIAQVTDALGGAFTPEQVAALLGLDTFESDITIAVELAQVDEARAELEALIGLGGETPLTATINLALNKGTLSGDAAQAILNELAIAQGIPAEVLPEVTPEGIAEAQAFITAHPGLLPVGIELPEVLPPLPVPPPLMVPVAFDFGQISADMQGAVGELGGLVGTADWPTQATVLHIIADKADFDLAVEQVHAAVGEMNQTSATVTVTPTGVEPTQEALTGLVTSLTGLGQMTTAPVVTVDPTVPNENIEGLVTALGDLDAMVIDPPVSVPGATGSKATIDDLLTSSTNLGNMSIDPTVSTPGASAAINQIDSLQRKADALDGKVIDITVRQTGTTDFAMGGIVGPMGGRGGEAGPELASFRGVTRLITSPTRLQPGTLVTPLSGLGGGVSAPPTKIVNNYMTITPLAADPMAVGTQIVNRAAAMANR